MWGWLEKKAEKAIEAPDWVTLGKGPVTHVRLEKKRRFTTLFPPLGIWCQSAGTFTQLCVLVCLSIRMILSFLVPPSYDYKCPFKTLDISRCRGSAGIEHGDVNLGFPHVANLEWRQNRTMTIFKRWLFGNPKLAAAKFALPYLSRHLDVNVSGKCLPTTNPRDPKLPSSILVTEPRAS